LDKEPAPPLEDPKAAIKTVAGSAPPPLPDTPDSEVKQAKAEMSVPSPAPTSAPPSKPDDLKTPPSPSAGTEPKPIMIPAAGGAADHDPGRGGRAAAADHGTAAAEEERSRAAACPRFQRADASGTEQAGGGEDRGLRPRRAAAGAGARAGADAEADARRGLQV